MARGRKAGKRTNKTVRISIPKRTYLILYGIAGNNDVKFNKLVRTILEERLNSSTVAELSNLLEKKKETEEEKSDEKSDIEKTTEVGE